MKLSLLTFPWLSVTCIGLAFGLLGWQLSSLSMIWVIESWFATIAVLFLLLWRGDLISRWVRLGPTVLVSIFVISLTATLAIAFAEPFGYALVLFLSIFWGRLELHAWGLNQRIVLMCIFFISGSALTAGWLLGRDPYITEMFQQGLEQLPLFSK